MGFSEASSFSLFYVLLELCTLYRCLGFGLEANQTTFLVVDASPQSGRKIPDTMFGISFEEINHAGSGGLWSELVNNRGFEAGGPNTPSNIDPWSIIGNESSIIASTDRSSCFELNKVALKMEILCDNKGPNTCLPNGVGIYNPGFWGMNIEEGKTYKVVLHLRSLGSVNMSVSLTSSDGSQYLASSNILAAASDVSDWKKVELFLASKGTNRNSRIQLTCTTKGVIWFDQISVMPLDTYKGHGFRKDLFAMLADLKPRFLRFPGGSYAEGAWLSNAFRWKESIGPWEERPGHFNDVWLYWTDDGLGYFEFLQLAEDLGADSDKTGDQLIPFPACPNSGSPPSSVLHPCVPFPACPSSGCPPFLTPKIALPSPQRSSASGAEDEMGSMDLDGSNPAAAAAPLVPGGGSSAPPVDKGVDFANYFCTYGFLYHQKEMLSDRLRMDAYYNAIFDNADEHFRGKIVLDVGTGSGILAIWCAQAGAKKVYAVEATKMSDHARELVEANHVEDIVEVIYGSMEDVILPEKVDVIISEWMGYFLLRESMFDSVICARDRWLKPNGIMYPSHARMWVAPIRSGLGEQKKNALDSAMSDWYSFVDETEAHYGVDMSVLTKSFCQEHEKYYLQTSLWNNVHPNQIIGSRVVIKDIDCLTATVEEIRNVTAQFSLSIEIDRTQLCGFAGWFDVHFRGNVQNPATNEVELTTAPSVDDCTHWGQQVFLLHPPFRVNVGDNVEVSFRMSRSKQYHRLMDVEFITTLHKSSGKSLRPVTSKFYIE